MAGSTDTAIVGYACRLPSASNPKEFWDILTQGRCVITQVNADRWGLERFGHPDTSQPGKSYTWAAGQIDDVWGFDPGFFGISPRETLQIDPQQRLLLKVVWEALEHAGIPPSSLAGTNTGVYVGASSLDYANQFFPDPAAGDIQLMTGNTLSIISNRISYIYDLHGPSFTVDTACSSSLVALHEALEAIRAGRIDTAIVAGVNLLLSPFSFIGFSRASMLSPDGLCKAFDESGNGYVRSEGAVAIVLRSKESALRNQESVHGVLVGSGINSDGRTAGMSLPSAESQADLLRDVYAQFGIDPNDLAFVEAHGTGTRVGDPLEAHALGTVLGQRRNDKLVIGSVKTNIGHLEPASGLAGLLKSVMALKENVVPRSLHFDNPNPDIAFDELNLHVAGEAVPLKKNGKIRYAGVNSFGFGGANAHAILADAEPGEAWSPERTVPPAPLVISAQSKEALKALCAAYSKQLEGAPEAAAFAINSAAYSRDRLSHRLVAFDSKSGSVCDALRAHLEEEADSTVITGRAIGDQLPIAFLFSGNGSQWAGMGRDVYQTNADFRRSFEAVDRHFIGVAGWSLLTTLFSEDLEAEIERTEVAQPLLFAVQVAIVEALAAKGIRPEAVTGHSVGEVAAAWASGALSITDAVRVIHARSTYQEVTRHLGGMAALLLSEEEAQAAIDASGFDGIELAAVNSPRSVTISGPSEQLDEFGKFARKNRWALRRLKLDYPFHCALVEPIRAPLEEAIDDIVPTAASVPFVSAVRGAAIDGSELDAAYWWENVRQPVKFMRSVEALAEDGYRAFLEIGPRPVLNTYVNDTLRAHDVSGAMIASLDQTEGDIIDPIDRIAASVLVAGGKIAIERFIGPAQRPAVDLPQYPWQDEPYRVEVSTEGFNILYSGDHTLLGYRLRGDSPEWFNHLDTTIKPWLGDHAVDGSVLFPGAGFIDMAVSAGMEWLGTDQVEVTDLDIYRPLVLEKTVTKETRFRLSPDDLVFEICSRERLVDEDWSLHVRGRLSGGTGSTEAKPEPAGEALRHVDRDALYATTRRFGLEYGPAFQGANGVDILDETTGRITLEPITDAVRGRFAIHPALLDSCFHGLFAIIEAGREIPRNTSFLPVRIGEIRVFAADAVPASCTVEIVRGSPRSIEARFTLLDADGEVLATLSGARFRAVPLSQAERPDDMVYRTSFVVIPEEDEGSAAAGLWTDGWADKARELDITVSEPPEIDDASLLIEAAADSIALSVVRELADAETGSVDAGQLVEDGRLAAGARPLFARILQALEEADIARFDGERTRLDADAKAPDAAEIIQTLVSEHPDRTAEAVLLTRLGDTIREVLAEGLSEKSADRFSTGLLNHLETGSPMAMPLYEALVKLSEAVSDAWPADRQLRILQFGAAASPLTRALDSRLDNRRVSLTVTDLDDARVERARLNASTRSHAHFVTLDQLAKTAEEDGGYDLLVAANSLYLHNNGEASLARLTGLLAPGGRLLAAEYGPNLLLDLVYGVGEAWWKETVDADMPIGLHRTQEEWLEDVQGAGLEDISVEPLATPVCEANLILAAAPARPAKAGGKGKSVASDEETAAGIAERTTVVILGDPDGKGRALGDALAATLDSAGRPVHLAELANPANANGAAKNGANGGKHPAMLSLRDAEEDRKAFAELIESRQVEDIIFLFGGNLPETDPLEATTTRTTALTTLLHAIGTSPVRLWIVAPGAQQSVAGGRLHRPVQTATWGFARVAMNEYPDAEIRMIDIAPTLQPGEAASRLANEIGNPGTERELVIDANRRCGLRVVRGGVLPDPSETGLGDKASGYRLDITRQGSLDGLVWHRTERAAAEGDAVEIEVAATGLNFRDVMWALGMLPDEALEDGFAGPTLGMECAGTVVSVGPDVSRFKPGDRILTFAPACFSSHVVVSERACAPVPSSVDLEEAATIPVTFLTAYYALVQLAHLDEEETVLIHGGAGGVGLAALQIAKWRGATVVATAGSPDKRDFLRVLGADHVLDSRSLLFVDEVKKITGGDGVDVVLNSLSGEAMERSISVLKPFGRFLELGKRDYYANTMIGLRPFRQNLSYFGIDADQLLVYQPKLAGRMFRELVTLFETGVLTPLPYRKFDSNGLVDAFRLMQQSGHIGKIIVTPPRVAGEPIAIHPTPVRDDASYLIVGGFGGFGLRTARWLVSRGARNLVITGRRGVATDEAREAVTELEQQGVTVKAIAGDIADAGMVKRMFAEVAEEMPPIRGIFHTAMVLDDVLIQSLDRGRIETVLKPKVLGAYNLDRHSRDLELDLFVLFSSATTLIGNPGQANYVAANAYIEGLARQRRAEGLPALAVAWGAISDAGYLARNKDVNEVLSTRLGRSSLSAEDALDGLDRLLTYGKADIADGAIGFARIDWAAARKELAILKTDLFDELHHANEDESADGEAQVDLSGLLEGLDGAKAIDVVAKLLTSEIAKILRLPSDEIERHRPLTEIGMDSLMALELRMAAESRLGIEIPLMSLANGASLGDIAGKIVARFQNQDEAGTGLSTDAEILAGRHVEGLTTESSADLADFVRSVEEKSEQVRNVLK